MPKYKIKRTKKNKFFEFIKLRFIWNLKFGACNFKSEKGSILIGTIVALTIVLGLGIGLISMVLTLSLNTQKAYKKMSAISLAEAGIEKTMWEMNNAVTPTCTTPCDLEGGQFEVVINDIDAESKEIVSTGYSPNKANYKTKKTVSVKLNANPSSEGVAFGYALQSGAGGMQISGSSEVQGSLYSNGDIAVSGSASVENPGDAWAVGSITGGSRIAGTQHPNASAVALPSVNVPMWKDLAISGGTLEGNYSPPTSGTWTTMGPKEITGDLTMTSSSQKISLVGPLYVHGNLNISGGEWRIDESFGSKSVMVIVDGLINASGSVKVYSNSYGGFVMFLSTNSASSESNPAISYAGQANSEKLGLYAVNGALKITGSGKIVAVTGQTLYMAGSGEIEYEEGFASAEFSGGPGGNWIKSSWQEVNQ